MMKWFGVMIHFPELKQEKTTLIEKALTGANKRYA